LRRAVYLEGDGPAEAAARHAVALRRAVEGGHHGQVDARRVSGELRQVVADRKASCLRRDEDVRTWPLADVAVDQPGRNV
jgi:hypothetical protein